MSIWSIFRKKPEPLVIQDGLGVFTLEDPQKSRLYEGEINWLGQEVSVSLYCDDGALTAETALENLRRLMAEAADWDAKLRQCAVEEMSGEDGMVEIWGDGTEEEVPPITAAEFLSRISLGFLDVYPNGELYFDYDLDGMFTDHGLGICADMLGKALSVGLVG